MDHTANQPAAPHASPPTPRRWLQFSLRSMFAWITVFGVLLTIGLRWIAPAQQQRSAVRTIERAGGSVKYTAPPADEGWVKSQVRNWLPRDFFDGVDRVSFGRRQIVDGELALLRGLQLDTLELDGYQISDVGLKHLGDLPSLRRLSLVRTRVTDAGLIHLRNLNELEELWLGRTATADGGLAHLSGLTQLRELWLSDTQITDAGLAHFSGHRNLRWLDLDRTPITDAGLTHLSSLTQLKVLSLHETAVTDAGAQRLEEALPGCSVFR